MRVAEETLVELCALLRRLPGVAIESSDLRKTSEYICLVMTIVEIESLASVVYCSCGANLSLDVWTVAPRSPGSELANPTHLRYRLAAKGIETQPDGALHLFQQFGCFLVWHLYAVELITGGEANRLLAAWGGRLVS